MSPTEQVNEPGRTPPGTAPIAPPGGKASSPQTGAWEKALASPRLLTEFARNLAQAASCMLGCPITVRPAVTTRRTVRELLAGLEETTCCFPLPTDASQAPDLPHPWRLDSPAPVAWVEFSRPAAFAMLDLLLGSSQEVGYVPARPLTPIERPLLNRVARLAAQAMADLCPGKPSAPGMPAGPPEGPTPLGPETPMIVATFELAVRGLVGTMRLHVPCADAPGQDGPAPRRAAGAPLLLSVASPDLDVAAEELARLSPGDIVLSDIDADGEVIVRVAGIPKFAARLGSCDGRRAITITRRLSGAEGSPANPR